MRQVRFGVLFVILATVFALPLCADDVTVSGTINFSALDGSSLDHDATANGTFTVDDGNLTVLGTINCNDTGAGNNSACPMHFVVSGNFLVESGAAIYAENRNGGGSGGDIRFDVGGDFTVRGTQNLQPGGIISSNRTANGNPGSSRAGYITINAVGAFSQESGALITAASQSDIPTKIEITANGGATVAGSVLAGPHSSVNASTMYSGDVFTGGSSHSAGGDITIRAASNGTPAVTITSTGIVATQAESNGPGHLVLEGCRVEVKGLVASLADDATGVSVIVRSASSVLVDGRDLSSAATARRGMIRADSTDESAASFSTSIYAVDDVQVLGPTTGTLYAVNSNGGPDGGDAAGTVNVLSLESTVTASGNAFAAANNASGDQGGTINLSAKGNVVLNTAALNATGDFTTTSNDRKGGAINVRSYSGSVTWTNGVGDVRPTGSNIPVAKRGTITITHCTGASTTGTTFPTNGAPVGAFPTIVSSCSSAAPSLPEGEFIPDCNDPPIAANDPYSVAEGGTLTVPAPGVLGNDVDPDGDPITAVLVSGPSFASSFTLNADGSFSYTHNGGETTSDSFTYQATDGVAFSNVATVSITITPVNDAPVANNDGPYTINEGGTINFAAPGVLSNDTDPDGPTMTAVLVSGPANAASFTLNPDGSFLYVHDGSETLSDSFTYQVSDGSLLSNVATVSITITPVNDAPVAVNDGGYTVAEGGTLNGSSVLGNDTDAENDSLTAILVSGPANAASFTLNPNGTFTYVHNGSETTSDSFTYKANDGSLDSNVATVSITINAVNDAPVANNDGPYSVNEGGTLNGTSVLANDTDAENNSLTAVLVSGPANAASFTLNPDGTFTYVHNGSETTSDSFTYKANDGLADSNVATVTITITAVNDAPVANDDSGYSVNEGGTLNGTSVLTNDTDAENDSLTAILVSGPANASSFTLNPDGTFTYVHNGSETTSDSFTYKANDGLADSNVATVTITINPVNEAPTAVNDGGYTVAEGGTLNGSSVLTNDTDPENDTLSAVLVSGPANASSFTLNPDGTFTYVHNGSETTSDSFTYKANDGSLDSNVATVSITITPVNDAPVAVNDGPYIVNEGGTLNGTSVLANDTDAENNPLTAILVSGPSNAASFTFNPDGTFTYVHNGSETTSDSFTYKANDGLADSNVATVTITINPINDAPVANPDSYNVGFHGTLNVTAPGVLGNDTDADGPGLTAILVSTTTQGSLSFNPDGSFSYTHTGPTTGTDSFTYKANDGSLDSNVTTVTITIANQAPVAGNDSFLGVGNTELRVGTGGALHPAAVVSGSVLANDNDVDGPSPISVTAFDATSGAGGTVTMNPNGTFNFLPATGFTGVDTFNYTISDGLDTDTGTVIITINERVWYVNPAAAGPQTGRSPDPFATIGQAQGASAINDYIHVAQGAQATGILLKNGQRLIGSGVALVVGPYTLTGATVRPTLGGTVMLASNNLVTGLNIGGIGAGITGLAVSNGTIAEVGVTSTADGINLTNTTGAFTITNVTLAPGGAGLFINGGTPSVTATNLDIATTTGTALLGNAGSLTIVAGSGDSTALTANGTVVDLAGMTLNVTLLSASSSGGANGIRLNNTAGSFTVTGTGATAGSGGTIQNMTQRGGVFSTATNVTLKNMNFVNAATTNGTAAATCGDTLNATNGGCNAALHFVNVSGVTLDNVLVDGSAQIGINGNSVTGLSMNNVEVRNAGNEVLEHGVQFANLFGTVTVTGSNFHNNLSRQFTIQNGSGTMNASISGSTFNGNGALVATGAQGALISANGTANMTVNVQSSTFTNNFAVGYHTDTAGTSVMAVTINNSTSSNNGAGGILVSAAGSSTITQDLTNNTAIGNGSGGLIVSRSAAANTSGTISGNIVGNPLVAGSGCSVGGCDGIGLNGTGTGTMSVTVSGNQVAQISGTGIRGNANSGSNTMNLKFAGNTVSNPNAGALNGIFVQSGAVSSDTTSVCADIVGNTISGVYSSTQIRVRNRFAGTTFRLPGYAGAGNDTTAVAAFLSGQNGGATASATINANVFGGGAACPTP